MDNSLDNSFAYYWNYNNQLLSSTIGTTTLYSYDQDGTRTYMKSGTTTTRYPTKFYQITGTTTAVKHLFFNGAPIMTITGSNASSSIFYLHRDHLGGISVITDNNGTTTEEIDYYPYGGVRVDYKPTGFNEARKYIGEYTDATNLDYLNARYYDGYRGQFLSQDPVARDIALMQKQPRYMLMLNQDSGIVDQLSVLSDPQLLNSYSYGENNPIVKKDPSGNQVAAAFAPMLLPEILTGPVGWAVGGTIIVVGGAYLLSKGPTWSGTRQTIDPSKFGMGQPPTGLEEIPQPNSQGPKWAKWLYVGLSGLGLGAGIKELFDDQSGGNQQFKSASEFAKNAKGKASPSNPIPTSTGVQNGPPKPTSQVKPVSGSNSSKNTSKNVRLR